MSEIVVKGWRVRWIDKRGDGHQTRLYHAKTAADVFAEAARKEGMDKVEIVTVQGLERSKKEK